MEIFSYVIESLIVLLGIVLLGVIIKYPREVFINIPSAILKAIMDSIIDKVLIFVLLITAPVWGLVWLLDTYFLKRGIFKHKFFRRFTSPKTRENERIS